MKRRHFIRCLGGLFAGATLPLPYKAAQAADWNLWIARGDPTDGTIINVATQEGIAWLHYLLRDVRANRQGIADPTIVETLVWMQAWLQHWGLQAPIVVTSGLRTERTNAAVGGVLGSRHLPDQRGVFRAVDFYVPGVHTEDLARMLEWASTGGVGFYRSSNHIHLDAGPVRTWGFATTDRG